MGLGTIALAVERSTGYEKLDTWHGKVLSEREVAIIMAACEPILPHVTNQQEVFQIAVNIDRYLQPFDKSFINDIHLMLHVVENLTFLGIHINRFTKLDVEDKDNFLLILKNFGGQLFQCYKGLRDLCMLG